MSWLLYLDLTTVSARIDIPHEQSEHFFGLVCSEALVLNVDSGSFPES
jgi:hypothetical protein